MLRRRPSRERNGKASFGRRVPAINFETVRGDILALSPIIEEARHLEREILNRAEEGVLLIHPTIKHRVTPIRPRL